MTSLNCEIQHAHEWRQSGITDELIHLNLRSIPEGEGAWEYLFYSSGVKRLNTGRLPTGILRAYQHIEQGGWWCSGLDPLNHWEPMDWGRFKPNSPRLDFAKGGTKRVKYESPVATPARVSFFRVDLKTWKLVSDRYGIAMPETIIETEEGEAIGFWQWVQENPAIPIVLTEGEKKAACLLSFGFVSIALPGIWMGRRKSESGVHLHPDLCAITKGRKVIILFDYETRLETRNQIRVATLQTGLAIIDQGGSCEVALLPGTEKGVDDWAVSLGKGAGKALTVLIKDALSLADYKRRAFVNTARGLHKYKPDLVVNSRYLAGAVQLTTKGLVILWADMGTGKTELMAQWRSSNLGARFINNGHRVNLLKNLAERLKSQMYNAISEGELHRASALSITADSLYKIASSLAVYDCVFIDEACQYLAHLMLSKTCKEHQAEILDTLEQVVHTARLVVIADAHIDDVTVDFFRAMRPQDEMPFVIKNDWKNGGRDIYWYEGGDSSELIARICASLWSGRRVIVMSDSKRFIKKLEEVLNSNQTRTHLEELHTQETPNQPRVWTIHGENSGSEENVAFIKEIRHSVKTVDALLASPSLGTGVDMPDYHFDEVYGVFHAATQTATECAQQLWRYRPNVPTHVWVAPRPPFGYKSCNATKIRQQMLESNRMTAFLIRWDRETGERGAEKDWALEAYCQIQAQRQFSINNLRSDLRLLLEEMGNILIPVAGKVNPDFRERMKLSGQVIDDRHHAAVSSAELIDKQTYRKRQSKDYLKPEETHECEKYRIWESYGATVTPELVKADDNGKLIGRLIALEELLEDAGGLAVSEDGTLVQPAPPASVVEKDRQERNTLPLCIHWRNRSTAWLARYKLELPRIVRRLIDGEEVSSLDADLLELKGRALFAFNQVKSILGTTISPTQAPIWVLSQFLEQLGLKLKAVRREGRRGNQIYIYQLDSESFSFAVKVLEHRKKQQEEREKKRVEDKEERAEYASRMQAAYGSKSVVTPPPRENGSISGDGVATVESSTESRDLEEWLTSESLEQIKEFLEEPDFQEEVWARVPQEIIEFVLRDHSLNPDPRNLLDT